MERWIIPCNTSYYDVVGAFKKLPKIDWKQSKPNMAIGDEVYIYVTKPIMAVLYKCRITKVNFPSVEIDDKEFVIDGLNYEHYGNYMELELVESYSADQLTRELLVNHGLKGNLQGPTKMVPTVQVFVESVQGIPAV